MYQDVHTQAHVASTKSHGGHLSHKQVGTKGIWVGLPRKGILRRHREEQSQSEIDACACEEGTRHKSQARNKLRRDRGCHAGGNVGYFRR